MANRFIALILIVFSYSANATNVSGTIIQNTHWVIADSPYVLVALTGVAPGVSLTIDAGVEVNGSYDLVVLGTIVINGTSLSTVKFQNTRVLVKKTNLNLSSVSYADFSNAGIQLADETEFLQDSPKNSGTLLITYCNFTNNSFAYTKGYQTSAKLRIENSTFQTSAIKGYYPRSEPIELDHVTVSSSTIVSDAYNFGITITSSNITDSQLQQGCCGAHFDIRNSTLTNCSAVEGFGSPVEGVFSLSSVTLTDSYIALPAANINMLNSHVTYSLSRPFVVEMGNGLIKNSDFKASAGQDILRITGYAGYYITSSIKLDKVDFTDCRTAVKIENFADITIYHCNFFNPSQYAINNQSNKDISARLNYWGTVSTATIQNLIYDLLDDVNKGAVTYADFLSSKALFEPVITWTTPSAITYGAPLSATQLNATADVAGSFSYIPAATSVLDAGTQTLAVNFSPTDIANYYPGTASVSLVVNKADQTITFNPIAPKSLTDAPFTLNATSTSTAPITFSSSDKVQISGAIASLQKAGRASITANQAATANYNTASVTQTFCVAPLKPVVSSNAPFANLTSNAALGNQWFLNDTSIPNAMQQTYSATTSGNYKVQVTIDDCVSPYSESIPLVVTGDIKMQLDVVAFPNPAQDYLEVRGITDGVRTSQIISQTGRVIEMPIEKSGGSHRIGVRDLPAGLYIVKFYDGYNGFSVKFVKQ